MHTIETHGRIEGGKLTITNRRRFEEDVRECKDCEVVITVRKWGRRSNQQNRYYWGVVVQEIKLRLKTLGHRLTIEEVHNFLKEKFLPVHLLDGEGTILATIPGSTATMNKGEFSEYVDQVREWAAQTLEISIPDPGASNEIDF